MTEFPRMTELIPPGEIGVAKVEHFTIGQPSLRMMLRPSEYVAPGTYAALHVRGRLVMSDTDMERRTNWEAVRQAHGNVLIGGLGLGMVASAILSKPEVESVTVVEIEQDVIDLVGPHVASPKLTTVCADVLQWRPAKGATFHAIYFDIWPDICTDNLDDMARLHRRFSRLLAKDDPRAWIGSWQRDRLRSIRRREQRETAYWR